MKFIKFTTITIVTCVNLIAQFSAIARFSKISDNGDWSPLQLLIIIADLAFVAGYFLFIRKLGSQIRLEYLAVGAIVVFVIAESTNYYLAAQPTKWDPLGKRMQVP